MEEIHEADEACPPRATDHPAAPGDVVAAPARRAAEQRMYRALVDYACGKRETAAAPDSWAMAAPELLATWRTLEEKYGYGREPPEPPPQADGGSWRGNGGRSLDATRNAELDRGYARIREIGENVIAPAILRVAAEDLTRTLAGFDRRIKGIDRLKEKAADEMRSTPGITPSQALASIADVVRFTFAYGESAYTDGVRKDLERLAAAGFKQVERRNTWSSQQYKGINSRWREPDSGVTFEVQFHTQASLDAKELTHGAYERVRSIGDDTAGALGEVAELEEFQRQVNSKVSIPPGAAELEGLRPERRNG